MKKIKFITASLLFFTAFNLVSCSSDNEPIDPAIDLDNWGTTSIAGSYLMTAFNTSVPTDLNNDGTASTNQMGETNCFNNNTLILNADNTFTATSKGVDIITTGTVATFDCFTDPSITGTWTLTGSTLSLTYTDAGEQNVDVFTVSGNTLTMTISQGEIVGTSSSNVPVFLTSNIDIIYTK